MTQISISITDTQLQAALGDIAARVGDLTPALADIGEYMLRKTRRRFDGEIAPDGTRWKSLAAATIKEIGRASCRERVLMPV